MTKGELIAALSGYDESTPVYVHVDGALLSVECTEVSDAMLSDDEPIVVLS